MPGLRDPISPRDPMYRWTKDKQPGMLATGQQITGQAINSKKVKIQKPPKAKDGKAKKVQSKLVPESYRDMMRWTYEDGTRPSKELAAKLYSYSFHKFK